MQRPLLPKLLLVVRLAGQHGACKCKRSGRQHRGQREGRARARESIESAAVAAAGVPRRARRRPLACQRIKEGRGFGLAAAWFGCEVGRGPSRCARRPQQQVEQTDDGGSRAQRTNVSKQDQPALIDAHKHARTHAPRSRGRAVVKEGVMMQGTPPVWSESGGRGG